MIDGQQVPGSAGLGGFLVKVKAGKSNYYINRALDAILTRVESAAPTASE